MTTAEFLSHLRSLDVKLWADGGSLRCNAPKAVLTPELRSELRNRKRDILAFLREANGAAYSTVPSLQVVSRDGDLPLSFAQQRLWFLDQLGLNSAVYNLSRALRISGPLNVEALQKALDAIVARHEVVRTTFAAADGVPMQVISEDRVAELRVSDLTHMSVAEREGEVQRLLREEANRPFNLSSDLMLRATLLKLEPEEHILLLVVHHIASDGWSMGVLRQELAALYEAFCNGEPSPLGELPVQYADYAIWQRQWLQGEVLEKQLSYWKQQLKGAPELLELPTDRPRPAGQSYRGAQQSLLLPKTLTEALNALSRREGVTLFMTLLAAFKVLLHRYTGQDDIVVGSPIAGRGQVETEGLIGFFVNSLVLRTELSGNPTFREVLGRVRETALGAYAHQDLPFEKLVEELQPKRGLGYHPLFQVMFALQNFPMQALRLSGLTMCPAELQNDTAKFDLSLAIFEKGEGLRGSLEYNTDLFDEATIERMVGHFQTVLEGIVADPDQRLSKLPLLTAAERHQRLVEWNDTKRDYPKDHCIHQLFEAQVERGPDSIAVVFGDQQLTYRQLNVRANQLAHYLRKHGVGPEVLVGICLERSLEMIIAVLAILKAGGAYLSMEPTHPKERLAFILRNAQVPVLLAQHHIIATLPDHAARVVCLDRDWHIIAHEKEDDLVSATTADNMAYVIYTSGSTGRPKGVSVIHRGVVRLVKETNYAELTENEVFLQLAPLSFDASTFEIWGCLLNGAKLVVYPPRTPSPKELGQTLKQCQVTTLWLTSALFQLMVEDHIEALRGIKQLLAGGDVLSVPHVRRALKELPGCRLINGYGPTESTTFTCCYPMTTLEHVGNSVSIGRPIANTQVYIMDGYLNPVPIGVAGELYIGGDGLARGYFNNPEMTAEKFISDPFSDEPGKRLYKTGDLACYLPDGNIEFLGRLDHQVKIRGFRIELGEIEAVLEQHAAVRDAVVLAREDVSGDKRLVGYIVPNQGPTPTPHDLRSYLKEKLPEYMVPSAFVFLESLLLTPNGKVDRRALPAPDENRPELEEAFVKPRTPVEELLAGIWAEVLKLEKVGIHDNFFDLGGHSLLGTKLIAQIQKDFQIDLPLRFLFESPTIAGLAARIRPKQDRDSHRQEDKETYSYLVELQSGEGKKPVFFFPGGGGSEPEFFIYARLARYVGPDYRFYGLRARGADGVSQPHGSVEEMAADYIKEIQTLQPQGPYFLVGECIGGVVAYEAARRLEAMGQKVAVLALMDTKLLTTSEYLRLRMDKFLERKSTSWEENPIWARIIFHSKQLRQLDSRQRVHYVFDKARRAVPAVLVEIFPKILSRQGANMNGSNDKRQLSAHLERARTAYIRSLRRYKPRPYGDRIHIFVSEKLHGRDPTLGWDKLALKGLDIHKLPGDHLAYIREHVETTARQLRECLDQALADD